jgi:NTP pyrophosphatase (non-canonical NTP hydrolase)
VQPSWVTSLRSFQEDVAEWCDRNFPTATIDDQVMKMVEEFGELCHAIQMHRFKIRDGADQDLAHVQMVDAVGDMTVILAGIASKLNIDLQKAVNQTWAQVRERDWVKYPEKGVPDVPAS